MRLLQYYPRLSVAPDGQNVLESTVVTANATDSEM